MERAFFILILVLLVGIPKLALIQAVFHIDELLGATKLALKKVVTKSDVKRSGVHANSKITTKKNMC